MMPDHVHFIIWLGAKEREAFPSLSHVVEAWKSLTAVEWLRHLKALGCGQSGKIWQERYHGEYPDFCVMAERRNALKPGLNWV